MMVDEALAHVVARPFMSMLPAKNDETTVDPTY